MTTNFQDLIRHAKRKPLWEAHPQNQRLKVGLRELEKILPHRHSMLLVDEFQALNLEILRGLGARAIRENDPFLAGHFPGKPLYPGALQVETIGQVCLCLLHFMVRSSERKGNGPLDARALKIHHALFMQAILPGMDLQISVQALGYDGLTATFIGQLLNQNSIMSLALMEVYIAGS